jgi:aryl-alcohol dehydrogenase-like predicted oxidoreductase
MEYRKLGKTNLNLSAISFGASSLGGVFHELDEKEGIRAVHTAIDNGINFIDVSPYYGFTRAESLLGKALKEIRRDRYFLSTKVGRYGANGVKSWDYSSVRSLLSVEESMKRLNIDYIDLINVHDIEFSDLEQVRNETIPVLVDLKKKGLVGNVGITGLPLALLKKLAESLPPGTLDSVLSFCHFCLNDDALIGFLPVFQNCNMGVINAAPLSMGLLSGRGTPEWHPATSEVKQTCAKAAEFCKKHNYPIEKLAIQYSVSHPGISSTLVSTTSSANILQNINWANEPMDHTLLEQVLNILKPIHNITWENS